MEHKLRVLVPEKTISQITWKHVSNSFAIWRMWPAYLTKQTSRFGSQIIEGIPCPVFHPPPVLSWIFQYAGQHSDSIYVFSDLWGKTKILSQKLNERWSSGRLALKVYSHGTVCSSVCPWVCVCFVCSKITLASEWMKLISAECLLCAVTHKYKNWRVRENTHRLL